MSWLKRFIARLFRIQPEDLPVPSSQNLQNSEIKAEISREIDKQLQSILQQRVLPTLDRTVEEKLRSTLPQQEQQLAREPEAAGLGDMETSLDNLEYVIKEDEFPLIDEEPASSLVHEEDEAVSIPKFEGPETPIASKEEIIQEITPDQLEQRPAFEDEVVLPLEDARIEEVLEPVAPRLKPVDVKTLRLGIDFGTSTTAISIKIGDDLPEALPIGADGVTRYIPSVAYFLPGEGSLNERVVVGEVDEIYRNQDFVIRSVKRCLGCRGKSCADGKLRKQEFPWCRGDGMIQISENEYLEPEKIAYYIVRDALQKAITIVRERWQIELTRENVVLIPLNLGCSAKSNFNQREIIRKVSGDLGFNNVQIDNIVEEPVLAGFTFARFSENPYGRILIYDFGGGTFDVAILEVDRITQGLRVTVLTTSGDNWLGGDDIDSLVYNHFVERASSELSISSSKFEEGLGVINRGRLRSIARRAKEQLSGMDEYRGGLLSEEYGPIKLDLSRAEFERLLQDSGLIDKSLLAVKQACRLAYAFENARKGQLLDYPAIMKHELTDAARLIDRVILVGGVTKIPYIRRKLESIFPGKIISDTVIDPVSAVAVGGAYPREPQHYSLTAPPFGFYIDALEADTGNQIKIPVFEPYEYLDFHEMWRYNARAAFVKRIDLSSDLKYAKLFYKQAGRAQPQLHKGLGALRPGSWRFCITLDGDMFYELMGDTPRDLPLYPLIHPMQEEIRKAKFEMLKKGQQVNGTYNDWIRDMMLEN